MRARKLSLALGAVSVLVVAATNCSNSNSKSGGGPTGPGGGLPPGTSLVRFVHAVAKGRAYDFYTNDSLAVSGLVYLKATGYIQVDSNSALPIKVTPKGDSTTVLINTTEPVTVGHTFTFYAVGPAGSAATLFTSDSNTAPLATAIKLRFVNVAPTMPSIDVYMSPLGTPRSITPTISGVAFKVPSAYQHVAPGSWEVWLTPAGDTTVAVDDTLASLANGAVRTVVAMDTTGGGLPLQSIVLPDAR
jgi:trimeric autotransporter adhesin